MKRHHTKDKGDIGVLKVQADLAEKGWLILKPQTEHAPFDLVIYKDRRFQKVQVKYRSLNDQNNLAVKFESYWSNKQGVQKSPTDISEIDLVAIYCPNIDKCCYISSSEIPKGLNLILRVEAPKKNPKGSKIFSDYSQVP